MAFVLLSWLASRFLLAPMLGVTVLDGVVALTARAITNATVPRLLGQELLRAGNAAMNFGFAVAFMVGPVVGGVIAGNGGTAAALLVAAMCYATMALVMNVRSPLCELVPRDVERGDKLRRAMQYVGKRRGVAIVLGLQAIGVVFFTMSIPVEVVLAERTLHAGPEGYGVLVAGWGAGAVAGSAIYTVCREAASSSLIALGAAAVGMGFLTMGIAPSIRVAVMGAALGGVGNGIEMIAARTALQEEVEQAWMAVVMSFNNSLGQIAPGVGILLGGTIATMAAPRVALVVGAVGALGVAGGALRLLRPVSLRLAQL